MIYIIKVAMVTGSYPPDVCGVGDYTFRLCHALKEHGIRVEIITQNNWSIAGMYQLRQKIRDIKPDVIHIQYPTIGYGHGLAPQLLSCLYPTVVTLHEVSQVHFLRKISLYPFFICSPHIIFTNSYEREYAIKKKSLIQKRSSIIPIGSYISVQQNKVRDSNEILYFGLIRPDKGIEEVIKLASLIKEHSLDYFIRIIGRPDPRRMDYLNNLRFQSIDLPIHWDIGLEENIVAALLSRSNFAYLPFPDGASERRSSLLAVLANGVTVVTTRGKQTPIDMEGSVIFSENPEEALEAFRKIFNDQAYRNKIIDTSSKYITKFSWDSIASEHLKVYNNIITVERDL